MTGLKFSTHLVSAPLHTPFVTALRTATHADSLLVSITDGEYTGWGEAPQVWKVTGESLAGAQACVEGPIATALTGLGADDLTEALRRVQGAAQANFGAKAAVDVALHDLAAHRAQKTLQGFLGSTVTTVKTDVTLSAGDSAALVQAATDRLADGFDVLKVKVGTGDAAADFDRVRRIREAVGPGPRIRLDANQGWHRRDAVTVIRALEDAGCAIELVEQPVAAADLDGMAWITDRVSTPILADESVYGVRDLVNVIRRGAADLVNVKLAKCGGLATARTLLELAREHGLGSVVGSMMESHVGVGAAAALVAAYPTTAVNDLDAAWWLEQPPVSGGIRYEGSTIHLPSTPGLGVTGLIA
ncbi:Mandelate racemase/muconate lactonizing protein [Kribbella flavida DSM 17836]|uniref:Dipeptide epimerase n=1 Tax=Kribbella flavida (strain DSM 17836 / JCM 10339 / NBRC 14399) TaxID=479435 RepID=D2Q355_KRIFD|nr:dipeptide epimerase [Kribbella flavida]ADB32180.1 Mandelate racemase/muconate lactonizing protein [Kribbella flavida DSM 17836]